MIRLLSCVLLCFGIALGQPVAAQEGADSRMRAEYVVYSTLLDAFAQDRSERAGQVSFGDIDHFYRPRAHLVVDSTAGILLWGLESQDLILTSMESRSDISREVIADYAAVNQVPRLLSADMFATQLPVRLLSRAELNRLLESVEVGTDTRGFPEPLPAAGRVRFSRVGFSPDGRQAVLYVDFLCGGLCGSGQLMFLEKTDDRWQVQWTQTILWR